MTLELRSTRWGLVVLLCLLLAAALIVPQIGDVRAWSEDATENTAICAASGEQRIPQIISDGSGGAIITWMDQRSGDWDVYAQKVNSSGIPQWTADGVPICVYSGEQYHPQLISDGSGGAIITWHDSRSGNFDIYAQRVGSSGAVQWTANGVAICTAEGTQGNPRLVSDGSGGAIIAWYDMRGGVNNDIYVQRVDSTGAVQWTADGVAVCTAPGHQGDPRLISDGSGGAIITWDDYRSDIDYDIYAQRVDSAGIVQWALDGVAICAASSSQYDPRITSDGSGGAIITWYDLRPDSHSDIYAQMVNSGGVVQWTTDGVAICAASGNQSEPEIVSDGSGGAIITWRDFRSGKFDVYAQRVDSSGALQWTAEGVAICAASGDQYYPKITSDGSQGAVITWQDYRSNNDWDIFAQRVNSSGAVQWTTDGVAICSAMGDQFDAQLISDGSGGAIITWCDRRSAWTNDDIYAQRVLSTGTLHSTPPTVTLSSTATSPANTWPIPITATFSEAVAGFNMDDITVGNGTASDFVAVSSTVYTFGVTPTGEGLVTVDVAAGVAQNDVGTGNTAAIQFSIIYASQVPTITSFTKSSTTDEGDVVIITGTNFTGATAVKVGGTDALSFTVYSATRITAVVGFGVSGKITVTTPEGTATSTDDFTSSTPPTGSVNWGLIGGVIGAVLVLGGIVFWLLVFRRKKKV